MLVLPDLSALRLLTDIARLGSKGDLDKAKEDLDKAIHYLKEARARL